VTGRDRTCDAPRFRRALYRLSYGHVIAWSSDRPFTSGDTRQGWARLGSNQQPLVCETSALPLSYSPAPLAALSMPLRGSCGGEADAFRDLPRRRRGSSGEQTPGQGVEPRSPRSERGVLPVRRSRNVIRRRRSASPSIPRPRRIDAAGEQAPRPVAFYVSPVVCRTMFSEPLAYPSTLDHRPPDALPDDGLLRGGALEPEPRARFRK
jgi:hypothetical protein